MAENCRLSRRVFLENAGRMTAGGFMAAAAPVARADETATSAAVEAGPQVSVRPNMTGAYGPWLSETVL
jgi:hypothetical protein